jgi:hypothetical protein
MENFSLIGRYDFILFDLDGTLIQEEEYLFPAYQEISQYFIQDESIQKSFYQKLCSGFLTNGRRELFQRTFPLFNLDEKRIEEALEILRTIDLVEKISLFPEAIKTIDFLIEQNIPWIVFTSGNQDQQENKVRQINWSSGRPEVIYAHGKRKKPSFEAVKERLHELQGFKLMIGDSWEDAVSAYSGKIDFIRAPWI